MEDISKPVWASLEKISNDLNDGFIEGPVHVESVSLEGLSLDGIAAEFRKADDLAREKGYCTVRATSKSPTGEVPCSRSVEFYFYRWKDLAEKQYL